MDYPSFPRSLTEFHKRFADEQACFEYVVQSRWPNGLVCPKCKGRDFWPRRRRFKHQCQKCDFEVSPTAGTILQDAHLPIHDWFRTACFMTCCPGISANKLRQQLGCSFRAALRVLNCLRYAMGTEPRSKLGGTVDAGYTVLMQAAGQSSRSTPTDRRTVVLGVVALINVAEATGPREESTHEFIHTNVDPTAYKSGRLRLAIAEGTRPFGESTQEFIHNNVDPTAFVYSTFSLDKLPNPSRYTVLTPPYIKKAFIELKGWLNGTHHGVDPKFVLQYLNEFAFRFNRGQTHMESCQTLLKLAINAPLRAG